MKIDGHNDSDLFGIFTHKQIELKYVEEHLDEKHIDEVDPAWFSAFTLKHNLGFSE